MTGPNLPHLWRNDEAYFDKKSELKVKGIVIYFNENFLGNQLMEKEEMVMLKKLFSKSIRGLDFYGEKKTQVITLMHELTRMQGIQSVIQLLRILDILANTKEYHYLSSRAYDNVYNENETDRLNQVYEYVIKNFRNKIMIEDLAAMLYMTPTSFSRYFSIKNSKPFSKFVAEIRVKHACKLLTETDYSIAQICYECGFNTLSNFNKQFREIMLKKPNQYKKEIMSI